MKNGDGYAVQTQIEPQYDALVVPEVPHLTAYQRVVRARWYVLRWAFGTAVLFAIIALIIPPEFESVARLMPPDNSDSMMLAALVGRAGDSLGFAASNLLGIRSTGALFVGILGSNAVQDAIVDKFDLQKAYRKKYHDGARKALDRETDIYDDRKTGIISIKCHDNDRVRVRSICQAYIDSLNGLMMRVSTGAARREREFLEERLKTVKTELDEASVEFSQFASKNAAIDIPQQGKAMVESAAIVQGQLIAAQSELRGMQQVYGPEHSRVRAVEAQIAELQKQLENIGGTDAQLQSSASTLYPPIRKLPLLAVKYTDLYRRAKIEEAVFETLTKQYELAKVQEAKETPTVRVLDSPSKPEHKVGPPRTVITICGLLLGIALGSGLVLGRVAWNEADAQHPKKVAVLETWTAVHEDWDRARHWLHRRSQS